MIFHYFFAWYSGGVWGNLLASAIIAIPAYFWGKFHAKKLHKHLDIQDYMHDTASKKVEEIHDHLNPNKSFNIGERNEASK